MTVNNCQTPSVTEPKRDGNGGRIKKQRYCVFLTIPLPFYSVMPKCDSPFFYFVLYIRYKYAAHSILVNSSFPPIV